MFMMRFSMRSNATDPSARADSYKTTLDMCAWAERHGCVAAVVSEHHGVEDGYLPSPVPLAAAIAARTTLPISVAALLLVLYEPVKLAEDLAVVDLDQSWTRVPCHRDRIPFGGIRHVRCGQAAPSTDHRAAHRDAPQSLEG